MEQEDQLQVELLQRCVSGDSVALRTLYDQVAPQLFALLLRILHRTELAEEALQEVFLSIWRNASTYRSQRGKPIAWMVSIARNRALDIRRSGKHHGAAQELTEATEQTLAAEGSDPVDHAAASLEAERLTQCMQRLSADQDRCIRLAFVSGLTHEEIARQLNSPIGTIKSWVRRGLQALKECLA
jgi:RNA polymerase sigma-70 factor (ECF subfamily)